MMSFPATRALLQDAGYRFITVKTCPCGAKMELWFTPNGATMPMNPMPTEDSPAVSHWATCEKATQFRRKNDAHK